jgi:Protein of unknown function (DUF2971)
MWEQYAENHQGVCLMFQRNVFHARVIAQLTRRSPDSRADQVAYTQRGILENPAATLMASSATADADKIVAEHVRVQLRWLFFTKLREWQSEHEYRFVESPTDDGCTFVDVGDTLTGVILGWKFPEWQARGAREICESVDAMLWLDVAIVDDATELKLPNINRRFRQLAAEAVREQQTPVAYLAALLKVEHQGTR